MKTEFIYIAAIVLLILAGIFTTTKTTNDARLERCKGKEAGTAVMVYGKAYTCTGN